MNRISRAAALCFALALLCPGSALADEPSHQGERGMWGAAGIVPFDDTTNQAKRVDSPDHKLALVETDRGLVLRGPKRVLLRDVISFPRLTEILWAPNAQNFAVTGSDGGAVGNWSTIVYTVDDKGDVREQNLLKLISSWVKRIPQCDGEDANYGAAAWLPDSDKLLVIIEVPPHSVCKHMGTLKGVLVDLAARKVEATFTEAQLRESWSHVLGTRFRK